MFISISFMFFLNLITAKKWYIYPIYALSPTYRHVQIRLLFCFWIFEKLWQQKGKHFYESKTALSFQGISEQQWSPPILHFELDLGIKICKNLFIFFTFNISKKSNNIHTHTDTLTNTIIPYTCIHTETQTHTDI